MRHLGNSELTVDLLDPASDLARLGPRFCWGGYIWQVNDRKAGPLLAGPEWPKPEPSPFNGQGLPESFRHSTMEGKPLLWDGAEGLAPGAGTLTRDPQGGIAVSSPCRWSSDFTETSAIYRTEQTAGAWSYALERAVELKGRRLESRSSLTNRARTPLVLEWFAHPFFSLQPDGRAALRLPKETRLDENPGYVLENGELGFRRAFDGEFDGCLVRLGLPAGSAFEIGVSHPRLEGLRFAGDFAPFQCVLWANGNTVSTEPYLALSLAPGETRAWTLAYDFGAPVSG